MQAIIVLECGLVTPSTAASAARGVARLQSRDLSRYRDVMSGRKTARILVRNLEEEVKARLRRRAQRHGRSMEEEVRDILRNAVKDEDGPAAPLGSRIAARFRGFGLEVEIAEQRGRPVRRARFK
jgi:plasmid stability protein